MKHLGLYIVIVSFSLNVWAQDDPDSVLIQQIPSIQSKIDQLEDRTQNLSGQLSQTQREKRQLQIFASQLQDSLQSQAVLIDSLQGIIANNDQSISDLSQTLTTTSEELSNQIHKTRSEADQQIASLGQSLSKTTLYGSIAGGVIFILGVIVFFILRRKMTKDDEQIAEKVTTTRKELENEAIQLDEKLVEVMERQLQLMKQDDGGVSSGVHGQNTDQDHSLALNVADEIVRIEKNLNKLEADQKKKKPLEKALDRIRTEFEANGYEIVSLLNKEFDDRMNIDVVNFKADPNLKDGQRIISRVVKPQVLYQGQLLQRGQVDVSQSK